MDLRRARSLCMESYAAPWNFKTNCSLYYSFMTAVNNANPEFMKDLFRLRVTNRLQREKLKFNLDTPKSK